MNWGSLIKQKKRIFNNAFKIDYAVGSKHFRETCRLLLQKSYISVEINFQQLSGVKKNIYFFTRIGIFFYNLTLSYIPIMHSRIHY